MRRPLIAGNWKMNLSRSESLALARQLAASVASGNGAEVVVCPPFAWLDSVGQAVAGSAVALGAQNVYFEPNGAFTGETSAAMLVDVGCKYVILGHSERRQLLAETNAIVNRKLQAALAAGLRPIVCVGETLAEREAGKTADIIQEQFSGSLAGVPAAQLIEGGLVIAYEPVWAIGTGKVATPEQAQQVHAQLRKMVEVRYNNAMTEQIRLLYGGSVKPDNSRELLRQTDIDGALVGGASLKAEGFLGIIAGAA
ncbi:MAG: triose-phosphate isomerase [Planctomycetes bacterium]|nr:triose-phosphate isomerase [Planctomycetota bacterium]